MTTKTETVIEVEPELDFLIFEPVNSVQIQSIPNVQIQYHDGDIKLEYSSKPAITQTKSELIIQNLEEGRIRLSVPFISNLEIKDAMNVECSKLNLASLSIECLNELKLKQSITKSVSITSIGTTEIENIIGQTIEIYHKDGPLNINNLEAEDLKILGAHGSFTLDNLSCLKSIVKSSYGDLKLHLKSNEIQIQTSYGDAFCQLEYNDCIFKASNSTLKLDLLQKDRTRITNSFGSINAVLKEFKGKYELCAANGNISILKNGDKVKCTEMKSEASELKRGRLEGKGSFVAKAGFQREGWCDRTQRHYKQEYDVYNGGRGGYTTRNMKSLLESEMDKVLLEHRILLTVIMLGANDAAFYSGVDLEEFADNLSYLVDTALVRSDKVLVMTPTPVANLNDRNFTTTMKYRKKVLQLFKYSDTVNVYDTWQMFLGNTSVYDKSVLYHYFYDGLHLSPAGHERFFQYVIRKLDLELGKLDFNIFNLVVFIVFVSLSFIGVSVLLIKYHFTRPQTADYESMPDSVEE
ncbi:hypothetical protein HDV01_000418 [Terramyces sp. JEL0728]|nr:hypothetical protein HDV01_000418 [Terramyces sp. JEL0728]